MIQQKIALFIFIFLIGILYAGIGISMKYPCLFDMSLDENDFKIEDVVEFRRSSLESKVIFHLYTRNGSEEIINFDEHTLLHSSYDNKKETKIIIHGLLNNKDTPGAKDIKDNYLEVEDVNIIIVDWGKIAIGIKYCSIAKQTPEVGRFLADFIEYLIANGSSPKKIHLIGHSLGAHIAGYTGAYIRRIYGDEGKITRITGLDPARPLFENVDELLRLDKTDADFVDCIHTCGGLFGIYEPIGHVDFYPNGGTNIQPGCTVFDFGRCSHIRSHIYFAESILPNHIFPAYNCTENKCIMAKERMGEPVCYRAQGSLFVATKREPPFAPIII